MNRQLAFASPGDSPTRCLGPPGKAAMRGRGGERTRRRAAARVFSAPGLCALQHLFSTCNHCWLRTLARAWPTIHDMASIT